VLDDVAVVRRQSVEVAVRNGDQGFPCEPLRFRYCAFGRRIGRQTLGVEDVAIRPVRSELARAGDDPFSFGDLSVVDLDADGHHRLRVAFFDDAEVGGLARDGVEVPALHRSERGHRLP
jgi:hypothetical protein